MSNSITVGLSRQMALQEKMDLIANNLANMSTPGYRGQTLMFKEYISNPQASSGKEEPSAPLSMVQDYGQYETTDAGPLQTTGNPLDVAVQGKGWLGVQTPNGIRYTRDGHFTLDASGSLITPDGMKVASAGGGAITVPQGTQHITISSSGQISTENGSIGDLMLVQFDNDQAVKPEGDGFYNTTQAPAPATTSQIQQGMLEGSNVQPIAEMTKMIDVSRSYQATQQMMVDEHNRLRDMIQHMTSNS